MTFSGTLVTLFETLLVAFAIWAVLNENKFIAFEEKLAVRIRRRRFKVIRGGSKVVKSYYPQKHRA